jgi:hypothetical protein
VSAPTLARIPADASDDLVNRIYRETRDQTPTELRSTCPIHLNWRDRCAHLHEAGVAR